MSTCVCSGTEVKRTNTGSGCEGENTTRKLIHCQREREGLKPSPSANKENCDVYVLACVCVPVSVRRGARSEGNGSVL